MKNQLVKAEDFGIEEKQERELLAGLPQIKKERDVLEEQYSKVILLDVECPDSWKKARELRLLIQKNRTQGINAWHKNAKDYFLKGGQFVDAIKRKESAINERMESQLMEIEKFEEIQRKRKIDELNQKRVQEIEPYSEFVPFGVNLGEMDNEDYTKLFNGAKMQFDAEQERLRKAPIKEQMKSWIDGLSMPNIDVENEVKDDILNKFESFKKWALNQIENI